MMILTFPFVMLLCADLEVTAKLRRFTPRPPLNYFEIDDMMFMVKTLRSGQMNEAYRWPKGKIPYEFSPEFTVQEVDEIEETMDYIQSFTCVRFTKKRKSDENYLQFLRIKGKCASFVGNIREGAQPLYLDPDSKRCGSPSLAGHVLHELVHAIGFFHEHARDDRDDYIQIMYENLPNDDRTKKNYNKNIENRIRAEDFGVPYNYGSIMHYSMRAGSVNGEETITRKKTHAHPRPFRGEMGQREKLTYGDIMMIQTMYKSECPGGVNMEEIPKTEAIPTLDEWINDS